MRNKFQTLHATFNAIGSLLLILAAFLGLPLFMVIFEGNIDQKVHLIMAFAIPIIIAIGLGLILRTFFRRAQLGNVQAILVCALIWLAFSAVGGIPFMFGIGSTFIDGFFEAMSGFTTTGITMFTGLDNMPKSIIFWRALTQWIGGLGILTFFLAITHRGQSAHWLFGAESHKIDTGRPVPGLANTIAILWGIYSALTFLIILCLHISGMSLFDSVCHSFTALSTGGFSPHDASISYYRYGGYNFIWLEYILIFGMIFGGMNFLIHYRVFKGNLKALFDNREMKFWWSLIGFFILIILFERYFLIENKTIHFANLADFFSGLENDFRTVAFQVVSILTTTGFATQDIGSNFFGFAAKQLFLVMMVIGGCVVSTGGGIKVLRISILAKIVKRELYRISAPSGTVSPLLIDGKPVETNEIYRISGLFFAWMACLVFGGLVTALLSQHDALQSFSGMFSALGNIGPCYIPTPEMGLLHPAIKIVYIFGMLAGRLEILPVLLLFSRKAWQASI